MRVIVPVQSIVSITAIHAAVTQILIFISVPLNVMFITALIVHRNALDDDSIFVAISLLISNATVSFILSASLSIALSLCHAYSYSAITPGCWFNLYSTYSSKMTLGHSIVSYGLVWTLRILSSLASI